MLSRLRPHISPATVIAVIALLVALSGSSVAAPARKAVRLLTGHAIKNGSITGADVKNRSLSAEDFGDRIEGSAGPAGPQGPRGSSGPQGLTGERGLPGLMGALGPAGPKGDVGAAGPAGPKGDTGAAGPKGDTGPAGTRGDTGDTGPAGPKGDTGDTGLQGPAGPAGPANLVVRTAAVSSTSGAVECASGERATGGGFEHSTALAVIKSSRPTPATEGATPTGWRVTADIAVSGTVYVLCAS